MIGISVVIVITVSYGSDGKETLRCISSEGFVRQARLIYFANPNDLTTERN